jgi:hypothetical protein
MATVVDMFVNSVYRFHGTPETLVSDRDPLFINLFWQAIFKATSTKLRLSMAYLRD